MNEQLPGRARPSTFRALLQRLTLVLDVQAEKEVGNHAAAGALSFLLSAVPVLLLSLGLAGWVLEAFPGGARRLEALATTVLGPIHVPDAAPKLFNHGLLALGTVITVLGLFWTSRVFFSSIRRGFKVIWGAKATAVTLWDVAGAYLMEVAALVTMVAVLALSEVARVLVMAARHSLDPQTLGGLVLGIEAVPFVVLWGFFVATLRFLPVTPPGLGRITVYSLAAVGLFSLIGLTLHRIINTDQYELLYGVITNLVLVLVNVSVFFSLYYATATALFVEQNFDGLLLGRHLRRWARTTPDPIDDFVFGDIGRLERRYGRALEAGSIVFRQGDVGATAFVVEQGEVEIVVEGPESHVVAVLGPGEIFGETASLLGEPRGATIRARSPGLVLEIPPEVFAFALRADPGANRKLLGALAERVKRANARA